MTVGRSDEKEPEAAGHLKMPEKLASIGKDDRTNDKDMTETCRMRQKAGHKDKGNTGEKKPKSRMRLSKGFVEVKKPFNEEFVSAERSSWFLTGRLWTLVDE